MIPFNLLLIPLVSVIATVVIKIIIYVHEQKETDIYIKAEKIRLYSMCDKYVKEQMEKGFDSMSNIVPISYANADTIPIDYMSMSDKIDAKINEALMNKNKKTNCPCCGAGLPDSRVCTYCGTYTP